MSVLQQIFTWWNGQTFGTWLYTRRFGEEVGTDDFGNRYYRKRNTNRSPVDDPEGKRERRWVIYNGEAEASRIPPDWHAWLHHTVKDPPSEKPFPQKKWEKPHVPNPTGTPGAYFPPGSLARGGDLSQPKPDYEPWTPE